MKQTYPTYRVSKTGLMVSMLMAALLWQCTQTYVSPYKSPVTGYLVVEGYISGNSPTQFTLSRTIPLPGDSTIPMVTGATVQVEGNDNTVYPLADQGSGAYGDSLTLNPSAQYRLRISIPNGESYLSDFVPYKPTPAIDSVNWTLNSNGVMIYANTHDPVNSTRYYQWAYDQTWAYFSAEQSFLLYQSSTNTLIPRSPSLQNYECWMNVQDQRILIGSTAKLVQDLVYEFPLVRIPLNTQPLEVEYSILVKQYALTQAGYNFLSLMQLNTESLGSIFDVQPSVITGNIHCLTVPNEQVIGYISAGTVQQQRIFIDRRQQLPLWDYRYACPLPDTVVPKDSIAILSFFSQNAYDAIGESLNPPPGFYTANVETCVDCRSQGGTTQKPSFWPN
jgi:hypothetical protein